MDTSERGLSMTWQPEIDELRQREQLARRMGGEEKVAKHHAQGRLTVRERIEALLDRRDVSRGWRAGRVC